MSNPRETLLSPRDQNTLQASILDLRKIRTAATADLETNQGILERLFNRWGKSYSPPIPTRYYREQSSEPGRQKALQDAEKIGFATADLLIAVVHNDSAGVERDALESILNQADRDYSAYAPSQYANQSSARTTERVIEHVVRLDSVGEEFVRWHFIEYNMVELPWSQMNSKRVGVFAPLATDFLIAATHQRFMEAQKKKGGTFEVKPVVLGKNMQHTIFPQAEDGKGAFNKKHDLVVFCDVSTFGRTSSIVFGAVTEEYPNKRVFGSDGRRRFPNSVRLKIPGS